MNGEGLEQSVVMRWSYLQFGRWPELKLLYHIPNGGSRNRIEAAHLKEQGVKPGVPDLHLPVSRGGYHGLWIEMKYGKNKTTANQDDWIADLKKQGHSVHVCYSCEDAIAVITEYLNLKK